MRRNCAIFRTSTNVQQLSCNVEVEMYRIVMEPGIRETFPNVELALRLYLTIISKLLRREILTALKRVKNEIRTTMTDERLNQLSLKCIESAFLR